MSNAKVEHKTDGNLVKLQLEDIIESVEFAFGSARQIIMRELDHTFETGTGGLDNITETRLESIEWYTYKLVKAGKNLKYLYIARDRDIDIFHDGECMYCHDAGCVMCQDRE